MPSLEFQGKSQVYAHHLTVPFRPLNPDAAKSVDRTDVYGGGQSDDSAPADGENLIIHGDNLHALKALLPCYAGRVKCIYIDPPYNTGNEGWVYNDRTNSAMMREWLKKTQPVDGEDLERHDKWLCMMWPRLQLLKELLSEDGAIFVSIDDNEQHHLRAMMDEVFGERNFVSQIVWQGRSYHNDTDISVEHEYVVCYAKSRRGKDRRLKALNADRWYSAAGYAMYPKPLSVEGFHNPDSDSRGPWRSDNFDAPNVRANLTYPITNPNTGETFWPPQGRCWRMNQERYLGNLRDGRIFFGSKGEGKPQLKVFYSEVAEFGKVDTTWFDAASNGRVSEGTRQLEKIFGEKGKFQHPKPTRLIRHLLRLSTRDDDIVLDSFAGSGTTAQAVLEQNKEDGGNRKFILVECEEYADDITAERVRRVIQGVPDARDEALREGLGGGFTYCKLGESITVKGMLSGESLPAFDQLACFLIHQATGAHVNTDDLSTPADDDFDAETGFVFQTDRIRFHCYYRADIDWLRGNEGALNEPRAKSIATAAEDSGCKAVVFGPVRYLDYAELQRMGIVFCQLPYELTTARAKLELG